MDARRALSERNVQRIRALIGPPDERGCRLWNGLTDPKNGYATMRIGRYPRVLHKLFYESQRGPVPPGHEVHHICERPCCLSIEHLQVLTKPEHRLLHRLLRLLREEGLIEPR